MVAQYFAQIDDNSIVQQVIVVSNDDAPTEADGQAFIASLGLTGEWVQTFTTTIRLKAHLVVNMLGLVTLGMAQILLRL
jgi:hypothetical protein